MLRAALAAACASGLLLACGGGGDGDMPPGGGPPPPPVAAGPPEPVIVDETGVPAAADAPRLAVVGVALVPMDRDAVVESQTVLIENGVITSIGDSTTTAVPPDAVRIDGAGRYLMPGLIDMHAHLMTDPGAEQDLLLELAAGVTTVRIMWGFQDHLDWRAAIADGSLTGPSLFVASAGFEGEGPYWPGSIVVTTDAEARAAVREADAAGYDFIKVYNRLQQAPYLAILDEAAMLGIPVVGHVPAALTADFVIERGQHTIEHFARFAPEVTDTGSWSGAIDGSRLEALVARLQLARTWNCPTLTVQLRSQSQVAGLKASPLYALVSRPMRDWLESSLTQPGSGERSTEDGRRKEVLAAFVDAGVGVVVGTDTGVQYVLPGFSIHEELRHFAAAGLSPYEVLRAATADAAAALGSDDRGTIAVGRRADLLLLDADPLVDVANVNRRVGVMAAGRWFSQSRLMQDARAGAGR
ncbi:MAG TPA: amidohydrolase family protein [Steroidobacteraceae bacterium]|nr:amidohydrolase family protein [Steroidobacteraceae bacterium]